MSFLFTIGELKTKGTQHSAKIIHDAASPLVCAPVKHTNQLEVSYGGFGTFCDSIEVNGKVFVMDHPGYMPISFILKNRIDEIYYRKLKTLTTNEKEILSWLKFWIDWSIKNCKQPVIINT